MIAVVPMLLFAALVVWRFGGGEPDNSIRHESGDGEKTGSEEDERPDEPDLLRAA